MTLFRCRDYSCTMGQKTHIMGILNVTPDSFSDGGRYADTLAALEHGRSLCLLGADFLDIGGESTRPGHSPVDEAEEKRRVLPVIEALAAELPVPISVDTTKPEVARAALKAGAGIVNSVGGLDILPFLAAAAAEYGAGLIMMYDSGEEDVLSGMDRYFNRAVELATAAGLSREHLMLDPGVGFGKSDLQNLAVIHGMAQLRASFGLPVLLGASRKSFIGRLLELPPEERLYGSLGAAAAGIAQGADVLRVHDVRETAQMARVADAILRRD